MNICNVFICIISISALSTASTQQYLPPAMNSKIYQAVTKNKIDDLTAGEKQLIQYYRYNPNDTMRGNSSIAHLLNSPEQLHAIIQHAPTTLLHVNNDQETPLHSYAQKSTPHFLRIILPYLQRTLSPQSFSQYINRKNKAGQSPFFLAALTSKWDSASILVTYGATAEKTSDKTTLEKSWKASEQRDLQKRIKNNLPANPHSTYAYNMAKYQECLDQQHASSCCQESICLSDINHLSSSDASTTQSPCTMPSATPTDNQEPFSFTPETIETFDNLPRAIQIHHLQALLKTIRP